MASEGTDELYSAFSRYQMLGVLNTLKSGKAVCWLGEDKNSKDKVVMRELATLAEVTNSRTWVERDWKNWARGIELSLGDGSALYVRTWIEGVSLAHYMAYAKDRPDEERARHLFANIAEALRPLHELGKAHGLLKPNNIILTADGFSITDPWMGDSMGSDDTPSDGGMIGIIAGDPHYLSPENLKKGTLQPTADIYSLAVVLYEYLTGERPFTDDNPVMIAYQHLATEAKGVRTRRTDLSRSLEMILRKALSKKPADRFPNGTEFAEALRGEYTRTEGKLLLPKPLPDSEPFPEEIVSLPSKRKDPSQGSDDPPTQEVPVSRASTVRSKSTEFAFISVLELQRAVSTAQANPGASYEKLRELVNQERRTVGDNERIPPIFSAESCSKRLPASAWNNAPKPQPSTGPISETLRAMMKDAGRPAVSGRGQPNVTRNTSPTNHNQDVSASDGPAPDRGFKEFLEEQPLWFYGVIIVLIVMIVAFALLMVYS